MIGPMRFADVPKGVTCWQPIAPGQPEGLYHPDLAVYLEETWMPVSASGGVARCEE